MNPRFRSFVLLLALLLGAPATAAASPGASIFSTPTTCGPDTGPWAGSATDDTLAPAGWSNAAVNVTLAGTDVQGFEWKVDCGPVQTAGVANLSGEGTLRFSHRAQESGTGLWTPWVDDLVNIDTTTPVNGTTTASSWRTGPVSVPLTVSDATSPVHGEWKVDADPSYTLSDTATVSGTGTHSLHTSAVDAAGNRDDRVHTVRVDDTAPVDTSVVPTGWQHDKATITLSGTDTGDQSGVARMVYELNGNGQVPANSGDVIEITANGTHTLRTKVVDNAGNQSAWANHIVQVDSAGPVDTTTVPSGWVTAPTVAVTVAGTDTAGSGVAQIEWELVEDARSDTVAGAGPVTVTVSGEGVHTLRTRLTDGDGHTSGWKTQTVSIDTVLPADDTTVSSAWLSRGSLDVTVRGTDATSGVARVEYQIDGVPGTVNGHTGTATVSGTGEHVLQTRVVDVAGNTTGWVSHVVRLDPDSPLNTTPVAEAAWRQTAYGVKLNGTDANSGVAALQWKVNNGAPSSGGLDATNAYVSGDGTHTLSTRVRDIAGNFSAWRDETIRIDSVRPTDTTTVPATVAGGRKISITATDALSGPSGSVEWQLDNGAVKTTSQATIIGAGPHVLKTRVQDNAGNWSEWKSSNVTVDGSLPLEDSDAPVDNTTVPTNWRTGPVEIEVTANDDGVGVEYVEYRMNGTLVSGANHTKFTVAADGVHEIETRATDKAGNVGAWRSHTLRIDTTSPTVSTLASGWVKSRSVELTGTDETSGVASVDYRIGSGTVVKVAGDHATFTLPGDGTFDVSYRVVDNAGQASSWKTSQLKVDTVVPANTSAAAPTAWQTTPLALDITGTDVGSGVDRAEWRIGTGEVKTGTPAAVTSEGTHSLQTRLVDKAGNASPWRAETVRVDLTAPTNTTPAVPAGWRKANFATTVTGSDATSGVLRVEWKLDDAPAPTTSPAVSVTGEGSFKLHSRVLDNAGNASAWREDVVAIDRTAPTLSVDCGSATVWRNAPAACNVSASGGVSGLSVLTGARGDEGPVDVAGGVYTVAAEGSSTVTFRAVDGAGNEVTAQGSVKVDRTAPAATVACAPDAKSLSYTCTAGGSDALSGLTSLAWSVNGGAATPLAAGATFTVAHGQVVVAAADAAGNTGASQTLTLSERRADTTVTPRSTSEPVLLRGRASASKRLVGQLALAATPTATTVDLRPMALGKGTFRISLKVTVGKKAKAFTKTQTTVKGYSKRVTVKTTAGATAKVALTVERKSGARWVTHAAASAHL